MEPKLPKKDDYPHNRGSKAFNTIECAEKVSLLLPKLQVLEPIGSGANAIVFELFSKEENMKYAAKFVPNNNYTNISEMMKERLILKKLKNEEGFPFIKETLNENLIVMNLLGKNLQTLRNHHKFSLKTILMIGIQTVQRLEKLHETGFLHRDVKPENFVIGGDKSNENVIHLIDFGLSTPYLNQDKKHIEFTKKTHIKGTIYYLSIYSHFGLEASRRDDLISLGYMLIHLFFGELPWISPRGKNRKEKLQNLHDTKLNWPTSKLCEGLPEEMALYFESVYKLKFAEKPKYSYLIGLFKKMMFENKLENGDGEFEWSSPKIKQITNGIDLNARKITSRPLNQYAKTLHDDN